LNIFDWQYFKSATPEPRAFAPSWKIQNVLKLKRQKVKLMPQFPKVKAGPWLGDGQHGDFNEVAPFSGGN